MTANELEFETIGATIALPLSGLKIQSGGAHNRLLFFSHSTLPDWKVYTSDRSILNHPHLNIYADLAAQITALKRQKQAAGLNLLFILALLAGALFGLYQLKEPIVKKIAAGIPLEWEQQLGDTAYQQITLSQRPIEDAHLQLQFKQLTALIAPAIADSPYQFQFHIVEDATLNAFALPGGIVVVHSGLILAAEQPEELLGVLAHEMAHVTEKHVLRQMIGSSGLFIVVQAVFGDMTGLLSVIANNSAFLLTRKFSRDYEREADETGWKYMVAADLNPGGMIDMFKKLQAEEQRILANHPLGEVAPEMTFLSTHPAVTERIDHLEKKLGGDPALSKLPPCSFPYAKFQEQLRSRIGQARK